jgi:hypothetical protein
MEVLIEKNIKAFLLVINKRILNIKSEVLKSEKAIRIISNQITKNINIIKSLELSIHQVKYAQKQFKFFNGIELNNTEQWQKKGYELLDIAKKRNQKLKSDLENNIQILDPLKRKINKLVEQKERILKIKRKQISIKNMFMEEEFDNQEMYLNI